MKRAVSFFLAVAFVFFPIGVLAMGSSNYRIDVDTLNSGGGASDSDNFSTFDSIGEAFVGGSSSDNFRDNAGFEAVLIFGISLELDSATKNLGNVTSGTPVTGTTIATVVTDAWGGYDLSIYQDKNLTHTDLATQIPAFSCSINAPCLWSGYGLGFTVQSGTNVEGKWYSNPNYYYAAIPGSASIFHTKESYKSGDDVTTVEYKMDVPISQKSGFYSNVITYVATARI